MRLLSGRWYGSAVRQQRVAGLVLSETHYNAKLRLPSHAHECAYFCLVLQGGYTESSGGRSRSCTASALIFHPAEESHSDHFLTDARCFNIQVDGSWLDRLRELPVGLKEQRFLRGGIATGLALRLYEEFRRRDEMSPLIIEGLALEMLGEIGRKPAVLHEKTPPPWLSDARDLLREQFSQRLTIHEIAQAVGVHPVHLAREFRRFYGYTVGGFVRHLRLVYSCKKLVQSRMPLREIALAGGFFDQSHFARTFKRHFGKTPEDYRRAFQHPGSDRLQPYQRPEA